MRIIQSKQFWFGAIAGVVVVNVVLPRFAPGLRAKLPV